uniref:Uncharacterized protein n=2 Tax=Lygus hesperus TaxID=30085 RepID=A0A0A9XAF0_LYGHE
MKPRSPLTLKNPTDAAENREKNLEFQQCDSVSPEIRRSVEQCQANLNIGYRSTWRTRGLKKISIHQNSKRQSEIIMAARRKQQRTDYLDLKRRGDEHQHIHEVQTPSSSTTVGNETLTEEGASSLESLQRLVTGRKEYLEMSQSRKMKLQWYRRVTRQSEQLLNFLRASDRSSGDTLVNDSLVLVRPSSTAEPIRQEPLAEQQQVNSRVTSTQPKLTTTSKPFETTSKRQKNTSVTDQSKPKNHKSENRRPSRARKSNIGNDQGKLNVHMAKPTGYDSGAQQDDTNQAPYKRKILENMEGDDKENQVMGHNLGDDSIMCLRTLNLNTDSRKYNNSNTNAFNNSGNFHKNGDKGLSPTRNPSGVPTNQTWSSIKRKRVNSSWTNYTKSGAEGSNIKAEAVGPEMESLGEARVPRPEDSIWWTIRKMWKKHEKGTEMRPDDLGESLSSVEDDPPKGGGFNPYKMLSRARVGRTIKRRRRDTKSSATMTSDDDEADYPSGLTDLQSVGQPSGRAFVIPDQPYEVEEALSMDIIHTAYDFIHNG